MDRVHGSVHRGPGGVGRRRATARGGASPEREGAGVPVGQTSPRRAREHEGDKRNPPVASSGGEEAGKGVGVGEGDGGDGELVGDSGEMGKRAR